MVKGDMTISHVSDLKERLVDAFDKAGEVTVDVSASTAVDVAGVQLLTACHRFAVGRGLQMNLFFGENHRFLEFLDQVGLARDFISNHANADI